MNENWTEKTKRLLNDATPGTWYMTGQLYEDEVGVAGGVRQGLVACGCEGGSDTDLLQDGSENDYKLIAHLHNTTPEVLAVVEVARICSSGENWRVVEWRERLSKALAALDAKEKEEKNK